MIAIKIGGAIAGSSSGIRDLLKFVQSNGASKPLVVTSAVKSCTNTLVQMAQDVPSGLSTIDDAILRFVGLHEGLITELGLPKEIIDPEIKGLRESLQKVAEKRKASRMDRDAILRFGEDAAVRIVSGYLGSNGVNTTPFYSERALILTNDGFGSADVIMDKTIERVKESLSSLGDNTPIIAGFVGKTLDGNITTTGRNSSDYTACIIAGAMGCDRVFICKDVQGVMDSDPSIVQNASRIPQLSFDQALEISELGGKVIHPKAVRICSDFGMEISISKLNAKEGEGTVISSKAHFEKAHFEKGSSTDEADSILAGRPSGGGKCFLAIGCKGGVLVIRITSPLMVGTHGFLEKIFRVFAVHRVPIDIVSTSQASVSVTVDDSFASISTGSVFEELIEDLKELGEIVVSPDCATIGIVSNEGGLRNPSNVVAIFRILEQIGQEAKIVSQSDSGMSISLVVDGKDCTTTLQALHKGLIEC